MSKKVILFVTVLMLLFCACAPASDVDTTVSPSEEVFVPTKLEGENGLFTYEFTGLNAAEPGYAGGVVTVECEGEYSLFWSDENGALELYECITRADAANKSKYEFAHNAAVPPEATGLVLYIGQKQADSITLPEQKRIAQEAETSFASVSDIHLNYTGLGAAKKWKDALIWFKELGLPYIISAGDIGENGSESEWRLYSQCIKKSGYTDADVNEAMGNHDTPNPQRFIEATAEGIRTGSEPYYYILRQGENGARDNLFIFMAPEISKISATNLEDNFSPQQMDWVEGLVEQYSGKANIFIVQHAVMRNFGPGDRYNGKYVQPMMFDSRFEQNIRLRKLLTQHKEIIMFNGHTHLSFRENLNFTDEYARIVHNGSVSQPRSYTASGTISYDSEGRTTASYGSEGYIVRVYGKSIVFLGADLSTHKIIPEVCFITPVI